ncbi:MAG: methyltransferase family protein [Acidimicrobiales bacterium]
MNRQLTGWLFVAAQAVLLGALILLPTGDDWATPAWLRTFGYLCILVGLGLVAIAALRLGSALTPTPVPRGDGELATGGLYRFMRHPIYTGVLVIVIGLTIRSGSWLTLAVGLLTIAFFNQKAKWEEAQLAERYTDYAAYASSTPRFVPRLAARTRQSPGAQ